MLDLHVNAVVFAYIKATAGQVNICRMGPKMPKAEITLKIKSH